MTLARQDEIGPPDRLPPRADVVAVVLDREGAEAVVPLAVQVARARSSAAFVLTLHRPAWWWLIDMPDVVDGMSAGGPTRCESAAAELSRLAGPPCPELRFDAVAGSRAAERRLDDLLLTGRYDTVLIGAAGRRSLRRRAERLRERSAPHCPAIVLPTLWPDRLPEVLGD